jgi:cyanate permease
MPKSVVSLIVKTEVRTIVSVLVYQVLLPSVTKKYSKIPKMLKVYTIYLDKI